MFLFLIYFGVVVQIVHTKKPRLTLKQNREQIYVGTVEHCPGAVTIVSNFSNMGEALPPPSLESFLIGGQADRGFARS